MKKKVLILGVSGMLGSTLSLTLIKNFKIYAVYNKQKVNFLNDKIQYEFKDSRNVSEIIFNIKPNFIINCLGLIPQNISSYDKGKMLYVNGKLPHEIANNIKGMETQFIQISTDCVFNGSHGNRLETDKPDNNELYGISKTNGEIIDKYNLTIRTSIIGHEIKRKKSFLEWFLNNDQKRVEGYKNAYFSGLTTLEFSNIIASYMLANTKYFGLYHVSGPKINKYDLLKIIGKTYQKNIIIKENLIFNIDRSLNSQKAITEGLYKQKSWSLMILEQSKFYKKYISIFK